MIPAAVAIAGAVALWLATGVEPGDVALYLAYELGLVIAPGYAIFRALCPAPAADRVTQLVYGWLIGLVLEILCFCLTAALGARWLLPFLLGLVGVAASAVLWVRLRRAAVPDAGSSAPGAGPVPGFSAAQQWAIAAVCLGVFAYLGFSLIATSPIPGSVDEVRYNLDTLFGIGIAADLANHWPGQFPHIAGLKLNYHFFGHVHLASVHQVTGIELPVLYLRLILLPLVTLIALGLAAAGKAIAGNGWAGPLAAGLFLLIGEVDLVTPQLAPFLGINPLLLWWSLTHTFGLAFTAPLALLLAALVDRGVRERSGLPAGWPLWALTTILMVGAGGAKGVLLPLLAGGLGLYLAWTFVRGDGIDRVAVRALALCAGVTLLFVEVLYKGSTDRLRPSLGGSFAEMPALDLMHNLAGDSALAEFAVWGIGSVIGAACLLGPIALGLWWVARGGPLGAASRFILATLAIGVVCFVFLHDEFAANAYFTFSALAVAAPLSAAGICRALAPLASAEQELSRRLLALSLAWVGALAALAYLSWQLALDGHPARAYLIYPLVALALLALLVWGLMATAEQRPQRLAVLVVVTLLTAGADLLLDTVPETQRKVSAGEPLYNTAFAGARGEVVDGARWIRDNLDEDAVLSVSNQRTAAGRAYGPLNLDFPAFAERRTLYEGWATTGAAVEEGGNDVVAGRAYPYRERKNLELRVFKRADEAALREMRERYGVTHLVVDLRDGRVPASVRRFGQTVFANHAIEVIELAPTDKRSSSAPPTSLPRG